ncbi:MAG: carotenoid biosynthesis protein [Frankiaceae bacterium]
MATQALTRASAATATTTATTAATRRRTVAALGVVGRVVPAAFAAGAVTAQIAYPLVTGTARAALTVGTVVVFFGACLSHALRTRGPAWTGRWVAVAGGVGLVVEVLATRTGVPFGSYEYSGALGPALLGVPVVIPLAWAMMSYAALLAARRITCRPGGQVLVGAVALAAWDVFLDPQMAAEGYWRWAAPGPAFAGIPLVNFAGWLLTAAVMMTLLALVVPPDRPVGDDALPLALYLWTYVGSVLANAVFFGRPAVALAGGLAMGVPALLLVRALPRGTR